MGTIAGLAHRLERDRLRSVQVSPPPVHRHRGRRLTSMVVLVAILVPVATLSAWAGRTVLNTDRFAATVSDVTSDPAVLAALSTRITDEAFDAVNGSAVLGQVPAALQP